MGDWHRQYLENLKEEFNNNPRLKKRYEIRNSNTERLYLPYWKGIKRKEILSNPDMLLVNKEDGALDYILEVEYVVNYKKLVGIALLTDIAVGKMRTNKKRPKLILISRKTFPNMDFIHKELKDYVKNIEFELITANTFNLNVLV